MSMIDVSDIAAERISEAVYSEMGDVRSLIEDIETGIDDAIGTLESYDVDADERIMDTLSILRNLR